MATKFSMKHFAVGITLAGLLCAVVGKATALDCSDQTLQNMKLEIDSEKQLLDNLTSTLTEDNFCLNTQYVTESMKRIQTIVRRYLLIVRYCRIDRIEIPEGIINTFKYARDAIDLQLHQIIQQRSKRC